MVEIHVFKNSIYSTNKTKLQYYRNQEVRTLTQYDLAPTPYYHEHRLCTSLTRSGISNPRPGLTPRTVLHAVDSGIKLRKHFLVRNRTGLLKEQNLGHDFLYQ